MTSLYFCSLSTEIRGCPFHLFTDSRRSSPRESMVSAAPRRLSAAPGRHERSTSLPGARCCRRLRAPGNGRLSVPRSRTTATARVPDWAARHRGADSRFPQLLPLLYLRAAVLGGNGRILRDTLFPAELKVQAAHRAQKSNECRADRQVSTPESSVQPRIPRTQRKIRHDRLRFHSKGNESAHCENFAAVVAREIPAAIENVKATFSWIRPGFLLR